MKYDVSNESFLDVISGNMKDCIKNIVYSLQNYINITYLNMSKIFMDINKIKDKDIRKTMHFLSVESENIIKDKGVSFANMSLKLVNKKYSLLVDGIKKTENCTFSFYSNNFAHLCNLENDLEWNKLQLNIYYIFYNIEDSKIKIKAFLNEL